MINIYVSSNKSGGKRLTFSSKIIDKEGNLILWHNLLLPRYSYINNRYSHIYYSKKEKEIIAKKLDNLSIKSKGVVRITLAAWQKDIIELMSNSKSFKIISSFRNPNSGAKIYVYQAAR